MRVGFFLEHDASLCPYCKHPPEEEKREERTKDLEEKEAKKEEERVENEVLLQYVELKISESFSEFDEKEVCCALDGAKGALLQEYAKFLTLMRLTADGLSPGGGVDEVWHFHILHTAQYRRFCAQVFGKFLHHVPTEPDASAVKRTLELYVEVFKRQAPSWIWAP